MIQHQVQFDYALGVANVVQLDIDRHASITVESKRTSLSLKRNFRRPTALVDMISNSLLEHLSGVVCVDIEP